ncbi:hypothetical protein SNEBB_001788 [Seison nebaliae]|nr:hypothetical protein SNEBB_001788 [Seison nebaliae]
MLLKLFIISFFFIYAYHTSVVHDGIIRMKTIQIAKSSVLYGRHEMLNHPCRAELYLLIDKYHLLFLTDPDNMHYSYLQMNCTLLPKLYVNDKFKPHHLVDVCPKPLLYDIIFSNAYEAIMIINHQVFYYNFLTHDLSVGAKFFDSHLNLLPIDERLIERMFNVHCCGEQKNEAELTKVAPKQELDDEPKNECDRRSHMIIAAFRQNFYNKTIFISNDNGRNFFLYEIDYNHDVECGEYPNFECANHRLVLDGSIEYATPFIAYPFILILLRRTNGLFVIFPYFHDKNVAPELIPESVSKIRVDVHFQSKNTKVVNDADEPIRIIQSRTDFGSFFVLRRKAFYYSPFFMSRSIAEVKVINSPGVLWNANDLPTTEQINAEHLKYGIETNLGRSAVDYSHTSFDYLEDDEEISHIISKSCGQFIVITNKLGVIYGHESMWGIDKAIKIRFTTNKRDRKYYGFFHLNNYDQSVIVLTNPISHQMAIMESIIDQYHVDLKARSLNSTSRYWRSVLKIRRRKRKATKLTKEQLENELIIDEEAEQMIGEPRDGKEILDPLEMYEGPRPTADHGGHKTYYDNSTAIHLKRYKVYIAPYLFKLLGDHEIETCPYYDIHTNYDQSFQMIDRMDKILLFTALDLPMGKLNTFFVTISNPKILSVENFAKNNEVNMWGHSLHKLISILKVRPETDLGRGYGISTVKFSTMHSSLACAVQPTKIIMLEAGCPLKRYLKLEHSNSDPKRCMKHVRHIETEEKYDFIRDHDCPILAEVNQTITLDFLLMNSEDLVTHIPPSVKYIVKKLDGPDIHYYSKVIEKHENCVHLDEEWFQKVIVNTSDTLVEFSADQLRYKSKMLLCIQAGECEWRKSNFAIFYKYLWENVSEFSLDPSVSYCEILDDTNQLIWTKEFEGLHLYEALIIDPTFSFCELRVKFAVNVYGGQPDDPVKRLIIISCVVILGLTLVYLCFVTIQYMKQKREDDQREKEWLGSLNEKWLDQAYKDARMYQHTWMTTK